MGTKKGVDWDSEEVRCLLGKLGDAEVARRLGVGESTVWDARRRRGIPPRYRQGRPINPRGGRKPAPLPSHPGYEDAGVPRKLCGNPCHNRRKTALPRMLPATEEFFPRNITAGGRDILRSECHVCYRARQAAMYKARKVRKAEALRATAHGLRKLVD